MSPVTQRDNATPLVLRHKVIESCTDTLLLVFWAWYYRTSGHSSGKCQTPIGPTQEASVPFEGKEFEESDFESGVFDGLFRIAPRTE